MRRFLLPLLPLLAGLGSSRAETFYLGTYTLPGGSQGIYRYELNEQTGGVQAQGLAAEIQSPSYLVLHPSKKYLYAVNEVDGEGGGVCAFAVQADKSLKLINRESTLGSGPTHLALDREAKCLLVANYNSGSVCVLPVREDGSLGKAAGFMQHKGTGPNPDRQEGPHAHGVYVAADNRRAYVTDLGLDKIFLYKLDAAKAELAQDTPPFVSVAPGSGPRHLALGAKGVVYLVSEMANTVSVLAPSGTGLKEVQTITTLPPDFKGMNTTAEIALHPNGKTLYVSNRGHDSIASFAVGEDGTLTAKEFTLTGGKTPRFFGLNPSGKFLLAANQDGNLVGVFKVDEAGALTATNVQFLQYAPVCVAWLD